MPLPRRCEASRETSSPRSSRSRTRQATNGAGGGRAAGVWCGVMRRCRPQRAVCHEIETSVRRMQCPLSRASGLKPERVAPSRRRWSTQVDPRDSCRSLRWAIVASADPCRARGMPAVTRDRGGVRRRLTFQSAGRPWSWASTGRCGVGRNGAIGPDLWMTRLPPLAAGPSSEAQSS